MKKSLALLTVLLGLVCSMSSFAVAPAKGWIVKSGVVRELLRDDRGQITGVVLSDNSSIHFAPIPSNQAGKILPGARVQASGISDGRQLDTDLLLVVASPRAPAQKSTQ